LSIGSPIAASAQSYLNVTDLGDTSNWEQTNDTVEKEAPGRNPLHTGSSVVLWREDPPLSCSDWFPSNESFDEWAFSQWDFSKGHPINTEMVMNPGPLRPISPFPISPTWATTAYPRPVPSGRWKLLERRESNYRNRLKSLKRMFSEDDHRIIQTMWDLADIYYEQGKFQLEERLLRHLAKSMQKIHGFKHRSTLDAYIDVLNNLCRQGKWRQAANIHRLVHTTILRVFGPDDILTLHSTFTMSNIYSGFGEDEEAERLDRQLLQISLNTSGPRYESSLVSLGRVAIWLLDSHKLLEAEKLLSIAIQLRRAKEGIDTWTFELEVSLAKVLRRQMRHEESKSLLLKLARQCETSYGPDNGRTLYCYFHIAICMDELGQYAESESLLQSTLHLQRKLCGESDIETVITMSYLAQLLESRGRSHEAAGYYESTFKVSTENLGLENSVTITDCQRLGRCYEDLGRYADALVLYQRTIDQLRSTHDDNYQAIVEIRGWIARLVDFLADIHEDIRHQQDEKDVDKNLESQGLSADTAEENRESGVVNNDSLLADDAWMKDFVNFQTPKEEIVEA
jgi:tetratricopeptide (TPR) repeat protein